MQGAKNQNPVISNRFSDGDETQSVGIDFQILYIRAWDQS